MKTFDDFKDTYGNSPAQITTALVSPSRAASRITEIANDLTLSTASLPRVASGDILRPLLVRPTEASRTARTLARNGYLAIGAMTGWAEDAKAFDTSVGELNSQLIAESRLGTFTRGMTDEDKSSITAGDARDIVYSRLLPRYRRLLRELDGGRQRAEQALTHPEQVPVRAWFLNGLLPLAAASAFPEVRLSDSERLLVQLLNSCVNPAALANVPPGEVNTWWLALTPTQRVDLIRQQPWLIGNLNGVPVVDRDQANRLNLTTGLADLRSRLAALGPAPEAYKGHGNYLYPNPDYTEWKREHDRLTGLIKGSENLQTRLSSGAEPPYYLIGYRPLEGNGQAIVSRGNPDTSDFVTTFVPGTTSRLEGMDGDIDRSDTIRDRMLRYTDGTVATVTWYDYEAPQSILPEAASQDWAKKGGPTLSDFSHALRATHIGDPSYNNFQAHSYGGTTMGYAATHGNELDADSVTFVATPGVGVGHMFSSANASDLDLGDHSGEGRTYATRSDSDPIRFAEGATLGTQPVSHYFGAHVFASDPAGGHSDYWDRNNPALDALALIGVGRGSEVDRVDTTPPAVEMVGP